MTAGCWDRPPVASAHLGWASRGRILGDGRTSGLLRRTCAYLCLRARCPVGASDPALLDGQNGRRAVSRITDTVAAPGAQGLPGFVARTSAYRPTLRRGVFCRVGRAAGCRRSSGQSAGPLSSSRIVDESECGRGRVWRLTSWTASRGEQQRRALRTPGAALPGTPDSLVSEGAADGHPRPGAQGPNRLCTQMIPRRCRPTNLGGRPTRLCHARRRPTVQRRCSPPGQHSRDLAPSFRKSRRNSSRPDKQRQSQW